MSRKNDGLKTMNEGVMGEHEIQRLLDVMLVEVYFGLEV